MEDFTYYQELATEMKRADAERDRAFDAYEAMYHNDWNLPDQLKQLDWIRKVVSTDPHDAIEAGVRVFSGLQPKIKYIPPADNIETKEKFNEFERVLQYWLKSASKRGKSTIQRDIVRSALLYDLVIVQVVHVDDQAELAEKRKEGSGKVWKMAKQRGPFIIKVIHPKMGHVRYNDAGLAAVYCSAQTTWKSVKEDWGDVATKARGAYSTNPIQEETAMYYHDLTTYEARVVWVSETPEPGSGFPLMLEPMDLDFFPFAVVSGGTNLETDPKYQYKPMLASVYQSGQWETQNVVETLWVSDVIATAAQPKGIKSGPNPDSIEHTYGDPSQDVIVPPGHSYTPNPPRQLDQGLIAVGDRIAGMVNKSTVSRILTNGDMPSNTQFATINLATQTALGALKPAKELAEIALAEVVMVMTRLFKKRGVSTNMVGQGLPIPGQDTTDVGYHYIVDPEMIDEENLCIEVELTPDVPTDKMARINAASQAVAQLGYSKESALEDIGVNDPQKEMKKATYEKILDTKRDAQLTLIMGEAQAQVQALAMQYQTQIQMQAQQAQQAQMMANQMPQTGTGGQGFNPAQGGAPTQMFNPEATREGQTGMTQGGAEVQSV